MPILLELWALARSPRFACTQTTQVRTGVGAQCPLHGFFNLEANFLLRSGRPRSGIRRDGYHVTDRQLLNHWLHQRAPRAMPRAILNIDELADDVTR